jgi:hypothetical protein
VESPELRVQAKKMRSGNYAACLVLLYFLSRLVYRFMRECERFGVKEVLETVLILVVNAASIILLGVLVIEFTKPDLTEIEQMTADFMRVQAVQPKEWACFTELSKLPVSQLGVSFDG